MAGIGQSSVPPSDQSSAWTQYNMGRPLMNVDNHSSLQNKFLGDKRRLLPEENGGSGGISQGGSGSSNMFHMSTRMQTGFQSSGTGMLGESISGSKLGGGGGSSYMNSPMFQSRPGDGQSSMLDMNKSVYSGQRSLSYMPQSDSYLNNQQHRPSPANSGIVGNMYNGGSSSNKRPGGFVMDSSISNNWDNSFESSEFPSLNRVKSSSSICHMTNSAAVNANCYAVPRSSQQHTGLAPQQQQQFVNYGTVINRTGGGMPLHSVVPGMDAQQQHHTQQQQSAEFSIQQEDFPALPLAQNPSTVQSNTPPATGPSAGSSSVPGMDQLSQQLSQQHQQQQQIIQRSNGNPTPGCSSMAGPSAGLMPSDGGRSFANTLSSRHTEPDLQQHHLQHQQHDHYNTGGSSYQQHLGMSSSAMQPPPSASSQQQHSLASAKLQKKVVQYGDSNYIANIPSDMVPDAFGLIGLIKLINVNSSYENLKSLAPGFDMVTELNRDLSSTRDIFPSFVAPLSSRPSGRPHDMDYQGPKEYRIRHLVLDKLQEPNPDRLTDETLFWIFYNLPGEEWQLVAARQLMQRHWRFHRKDRCWLIRDTKMAGGAVSNDYERGNFFVWDIEKLQKVPRTLTVHPQDFEFVGSLPISKNLPYCGAGQKRAGVGSSSVPPLQQQRPPAAPSKPLLLSVSAAVQPPISQPAASSIVPAAAVVIAVPATTAASPATAAEPIQ